MATKKGLVSVGESALLGGQFEKAVWALNAALYLTPGRKDPQLWQRGLACFYCGRYEEGAKQFEADMSENGSDIEEVVWHFLCRCKWKGFRASQAEGFLPLSTPSPGSPPPFPTPPMTQVLQLYQGKAAVEDVLKAARNPDGSPAKSYNDTNALAYANFYIGLYYEMQGDLVRAVKYLKSAADLENPDYMGKLMTMHFKLMSKMLSPLLKLSPLVQHTASKKDSKLTNDIGGIIQGGWQLSQGHCSDSNQLSKSDIILKLLKVYDAGIRAFDCGDIYTGVEELYGSLIKALHIRGLRDADVKIFTKLVPDLDVIQAGKVDEIYVRSVIRRSLNRLGIGKISLVQFHWWDYNFPGYLVALDALQGLVKEGVIEHIGLTNFDAEHTKEIIEAGVPISTIQVQYSLLDQRPLHSGLVDICVQYNVKILAYGVLAGGFLTDTWLGAKRPLKEDLPNRSLVKYLLIIDEFGGWELFQQLLRTLREIANRQSKPGQCVSIGMVAIQYILSQRQVGGVIIGARNEKHLEATITSARLSLNEADLASVEAVLSLASGPSGPVYGLERGRESSHGEIMKYNLNCINQSNHLEELCIRYLRLHFEAYPTDATRTGYRLSPPEDYLSHCDDFCSSTSTTFDFDMVPLHAAQVSSYDHFLNIGSTKEIADHCSKVKAMLKEAEGIDQGSLSPEQLVDLNLIISQLYLELVKWEKVQVYKKDPGFYLPLNAILDLLPAWGPEEASLSSDSDSCSSKPHSISDCTHPGVMDMTVGERLLALHSRLMAIPSLLLNAHENLIEPVLEYVKTAIDICNSFSTFLRDTLPCLCSSMASSSSQTNQSYDGILSEITTTSNVAAECIKEYAKFLRDDILPESSMGCGIGMEAYEEILKYEHFIESSEELLKLGEEHFRQVKMELESLAAEIDPNRTWQEITEQEINTKHPTVANLLQSYLDEIECARKHMLSKDLISKLPPEEKIIVFSTPKFLEPFSPVGNYLNPSPFVGMGRRDSSLSPSQSQYRVGHLMLHSIKGCHLPKFEERKLLRGHNYSWISVVSPHESYPGHHVQALLAQQHPRVLRKFHESILFYEGWGLYTEELAYETGLFEKELKYINEDTGDFKTVPPTDFAKLTRLTQLRLRLWRAVRIILDVKLNTGEMTFEECREFLHTEVKFNEGASQGEVFMYLSQPGYAPCYLAGFVMLMDMREEMKRKIEATGETFVLKDFHDLVLSKGCIPFKLLKTLIYS